MWPKCFGLLGFTAICAGCLDLGESADARSTSGGGGSGATLADGSWMVGGTGGNEGGDAAGGATSSAITLDTKTSYWSIQSGASALSWQHPIADHPNRILIVVVHAYQPTTINDVTYAGAPALFISAGGGGNGSFTKTFFYALANPPLGDNMVSVGYSIQQPEIIAAAVSFYNASANVTALPFTFGDDTTPITPITVASAPGEVILGAISHRNNTDPAVPGAGITPVWNVNGTLQYDLWGAAGTQPGAANVTIAWSHQQGVIWSLGAIALKPVQ